MQHDPTLRRGSLTLADGTLAFGIPVVHAGIPIGEDAYVFTVLRAKLDKIVSETTHVHQQLGDASPELPYLMLYYSSSTRLDYLLHAMLSPASLSLLHKSSMST